jgi:hypothetical protein
MENERLVPVVARLYETALTLFEMIQNQTLMTNAILKALEDRKELPDFHASYETGFRGVSSGDVARRVVREQETIGSALRTILEELNSLR